MGRQSHVSVLIHDLLAIDDYAKNGGEDLFTKMYFAL